VSRIPPTPLVVSIIELMMASGMSDPDIVLVRDMAENAAAKAIDSIQIVAKSCPPGLGIMVSVLSFTILIESLTEELRKLTSETSFNLIDAATVAVFSQSRP
jgi:hypothetical protein